MESRFFNRELSLLDFQERVLALAENPNTPLLERVKFVGIVSSNLDEFFQVRVAGLREHEAAGLRRPSPDGMTATEQLAAISERCHRLVDRKERLFAKEILPALVEHEIRLADWADLDADDRSELVDMFESEIYPMLTPLAVDPSHPFPFISNLSLNLAVMVRNPKTGVNQFARVKVPPLLPRFIVLSDGTRFVPVEQVIAAHIDRLFPGMEIETHHPFRVTRSAEQAVEEEEAEDLLEAMESLLVTRHRFSRVIRLEVDGTMPTEVLDFLLTEMRLDSSAVYVSEGPLALNGLWGIHDLDRDELKYEAWTPITQKALSGKNDKLDIFERIRTQDILIHLPYDSFVTSVQAFIAQAAHDPDVVAIKQTLYRTSDPEDPALGGERSIVRSLMAAARSGKQVVVLIELKARFDEEANINWARMLEEAGVHVVYGVAGLKTHSKIALVVRREPGGLRRYSHVGTGNYNPKTAVLYEDIGILTADEDIGADLSELFNVLTGFSRQKKYRRLLVAPTSLRRKIVRRIRKQADRGTEGRIVFKCNHLVDPQVINELYEASRAGVPIDLIVRGICCLRAGVPGLSDNIRVRSLVGKYLEHSRIFRFGNGETVEYLIGSADLMQRNLNSRVEAVTPIGNPEIRDRLEEVLRVCLADDMLAWDLQPDGTWLKAVPQHGIAAQLRLEEVASARAKGARPDPTSVVEAIDVVLAAGGLLHRAGDEGLELLIVHRPEYDDWSFQKGKLVTGETEAEAALREVFEETGYDAVLGSELGSVDYLDLDGSHKVVRYWAMTTRGGKFTKNDEVDDGRWLSVTEAAATLSYDRDRALARSLAEARRAEEGQVEPG
jgi:polyphosphate kinase